MKATYSDTISQESIETIKAVYTGDTAQYFKSYDQLTQKYKHLQYELECSGIPRTIKWAADWQKVASQPNTVLVVVGAAHTLHEPSLPTLLAKQGYAVRRIED